MQQYRNLGQIRTEILAGLTVSLALVPEAVAFAFVAGVEPLVGLYAAFIVGFITSLGGGRPGMISGATGALAVVMVALVKDHGVEMLFLTVILMGIIQVAVGALKLGGLIRMVPYPVMLGFVNGLAIVIFLAQLESFKVENHDGSESWLAGGDLGIMLGLIALTMAVIFLVPKLTSRFPAALAGILVVSGLVIFGNIDTTTVGDLSSISGSFPAPSVPDVAFNLETLGIILPFALILAGIGLIESLLTLSLIDGITETRSQKNRECMAQGTANIVTGFFGGMGGCAMIGQSMINIKSGARWRVSGVVAAILLLTYILFASSLIERIPIAALVGVMFIVVIGTFSWSSLRIIRKVPLSDALIMVLVSAVTVATDLAIAVVVGVIVSALVFAWNTARSIYVVAEDENPEDGDEPFRRTYTLHGQLFFASVTHFRDLFNPATDPAEVVIDFQYSRVWDHSGMEAIVELAQRYNRADRQLHLLHLSQNCQRILQKADVITDTDPTNDPSYRVTVSGLGGSGGGH
ncbi:MAG: SulP family inorganic anion transporter [Chloroflexi bacterium]|jgi:sulfate permease, SulP family|nr:SulP family inorganic anion transporter [Chloroflexota bacterium]MBT4073198.1 SulP family inorganic anion transporter [Chloroflexota bacterium]MBT4515094.1 SulP family inorganic anion transporter [Chloroflexota bacterium]MBT5319293.1 SulP family inorganic anion transporter [Chloroflexota bacterium]MBT6681399.1 SulP family inorganic anion transporter [Chloroflexota bacterium]